MDLVSALIQAIQAYSTTSTTNNNYAFDNTTNAGWGANAYVSSIFAPGNTIKFSHQSTEGNLFTGTNGNSYSIDSALAFSEMGLETADGRYGDGDGTVSISEFKKSSGANTKLANTVDTNGDGNISRAELTAYYMAADDLDGNINGKVTRTGINAVNDMANDDPNSLKNKLEAYQRQIEYADQNFTLDRPTVDGTNDDGSYDSSDILGRGGNAGEAAAKLIGTPQQMFTDVQFLQQNDDGTLNIESGLAFATEFLANSKSPVNVPDLNRDGRVSADEVLANLMTQDLNGDGKITYQERLSYQNAVKSGDITASDIQDAYDNNDLESAMENFSMPDRNDGTNVTSNSNDFMSIIIQLLKSFGINLGN